MSANLFVYGTLLFDEVVEMLTGKRFESCEARLSNHIRRTVSDYDGLAPYPGIILSDGDYVDGRVLYNLSATALEAIEHFENTPPEYEIVKLEVSLLDGSREDALCYRLLPEMHDSLAGAWEPDEFRQNHLEYYINERLPAYLRSR